MTSLLAIDQDEAARERRVDMGLSTLLVLQGLTLFVAIPLGADLPDGRLLLDACHLTFAGVAIGVLTRHPAMQATLLASLLLLVGGPTLARLLPKGLQLHAGIEHEIVAIVAFVFNGAVTALVARHVFAAGTVTVHRVRGAVLLYLNVAALFAIAYGFLAMNLANAFSAGGQPVTSTQQGIGTAVFSYFSLATITTTGYGDMVPLHPIARSLANLEAVFGQLFPATLLSRIVSLHLAQQRD